MRRILSRLAVWIVSAGRSNTVLAGTSRTDIETRLACIVQLTLGGKEGISPQVIPQ